MLSPGFFSGVLFAFIDLGVGALENIAAYVSIDIVFFIVFTESPAFLNKWGIRQGSRARRWGRRWQVG